MNTIDTQINELIAELVSPVQAHHVLHKLATHLGEILHAKRVRMYRLNTSMPMMSLITSWQDKNSPELETSWKTLAVADIPTVLKTLHTQSFIWNSEKKADRPLPDAEILMIQRLAQTQSVWMPVKYHKELSGILIIDDPEHLAKADLKSLSLLSTLIGKYWSHPHEDTEVIAQHQTSDNYLHEIGFDILDEGLILLDKTQKILKVNKKILEWFGVQSNYFKDKTLRDIQELIPNGIINQLLRNFGLVVYGNKANPIEFYLTQSHDEVRHYEIYSLSLIKHGQYHGELLVIRDVTYRKSMEISAQESERRLRQVVESIKEGITLSDERGYFEIFNKQMSVLTGYTREEANNTKDFLSLIHSPDEVRLALDKLYTLTESQTSINQVSLKSKDGSEKFVTVSTTVLSTEGKKYFLSAFHDQTQQEKSKQELEQRNQELSGLAQELAEARNTLEDKVRGKTQELQAKVAEIEYLAKLPSEDPFPLIRIKADGTLLYANAASQALLDRWEITIGGIVPEGWRKLVSEVFDLNNRKIYEIEILGQVISFVLVPIKSGEYVNLYGRDVSKEKEVDKIKNQFISMVSHQIRTPITSVRWYSEMLLNGKGEQTLNEKQKQITLTIHDTAVSLTSLVNDLLSISRMESGKMDYNSQPGDIKEIVTEVIAELEPQASSAGIIITLTTEDIAPFNFDPQMLKEVCRNIIANAVKYTPRSGKVEISLSSKDSMLSCSIKDTGIGIPKAAQADIFKRFYRAQNAVDKKYEGTGLGLSVAKMIIEKAGGKIWFESEEGKGSIFYFTLPMAVEI